MTQQQFQFVPDGDDNHEAEPHLTLVPIVDPEPKSSIVAALFWVLNELRGLFCKYATFAKQAQPTALALWVVHTHLFEAADYTAYLHVTGPEKRSGKTRVLETAEMVVHKPFPMNSPSPAAIYAVANQNHTLLIDEVDTIFGGKKNEVARAALNSGYRRGGKIPRYCASKDKPVTEYDVFCPKLLAGIGSVPDTVEDRCIKICMERRVTKTRLARFRRDSVEAEVAVLNKVLGQLRDTPELIAKLKEMEPAVPEELSDRQMDIAEPLLAIADFAGDLWSEVARKALVELFTAGKVAEGSLGVNLLADIKTVFGEEIKLTTEKLLQGLIDLEEGSPWAEKWESKMKAGLLSTCANQLARYLKPYGIAPKQIRVSPKKSFKGYEKAAFSEAWASYCARNRQNNPPEGQRGNKTPSPRQGQQSPTVVMFPARNSAPQDSR